MGKKIRPNVLTNHQSKRKRNEKGRNKTQQSYQNIPLPAPKLDSEEESNPSDEDIAFVKKYSNKLSFLEKIEQDELDQQVLNKQQAELEKKGKKSLERVRLNEGVFTDDDELDQLDQDHARTQLQEVPVLKEKREKSMNQLPLKTADGRIICKEELNSEATDLARRVEGVTVDDAFIEGAEPEDEEVSKDDKIEDSSSEIKQEALSIDQLQDRRFKDDLPQEKEEQHTQESVKTTIALCANEILVKSEKSVAPLRKLLNLCRNEDPQVSQLALLSCMKVFKDIIPSYRIQSKSMSNEAQVKKKLEKGELKLKEYEALLLRCYQSYLKILIEASQSDDGSIQGRRIHVSCLCGLAESLHHFNYGTDLIKSVVNWMKNPDQKIRQNCCQCISQIIKTDLEGHRSLEVVQLVGDLIRRQKCNSDPKIIESLFDLSFPDINLPTKEDLKIKKTSKNKRRKMLKIRDEMEKEGKDYDVHRIPFDKTLNDKSEIQTKTIEALFEIFFRVLKHCNHHTHGRSSNENDLSVHAFIQNKCPLLTPCLQGLGKYAHVMSVEYFEDVLSVMTKLLSCESLPFQERFQCLSSISQILKGQGEALNIDRKELYQQLYWSLSHWRVDHLQEDFSLFSKEDEKSLIEVCQQMLCETKTSDFSRLAAFVKRLLALALHQETGLIMGVCSIINRLFLKYRRLQVLFENESEAPMSGGGYDDSILDPSQAGGLLTTLWELTLLQRHFNPHLSAGVGQLMKIKADGTTNDMNCLFNGIFSSTAGPAEILQKYSTQNGTFWPHPIISKSRKRKIRNFEEISNEEFNEASNQEQVDQPEEAFKQHFRSQQRYQIHVDLIQQKEALVYKLRSLDKES